MRLYQINEAHALIVPISALILDEQGIEYALIDILGGRPSITDGPISVKKTGKRFQLIDGYHRLVSAILNKQTNIQASLDNYNEARWIEKRFRYNPKLEFGGLELLSSELSVTEFASPYDQKGHI